MADSNDIPLGLCGCGCGQKTKLASTAHPERGIPKGQPNRYILGHQPRYRAPIFDPEIAAKAVCECGCGLPAPLAKQTLKNRQKGEPLRFRAGHAAKARPAKSYRLVGHEFVHRVRAEKALGKPLPPGAEVHHVDGDKSNPNARLVICQDHADHALLHRRTEVVRAGGNPNTEKICQRCRQPKPFAEFSVNGTFGYCRSCAHKHYLERRQKREAQQSAAIDKQDIETET